MAKARFLLQAATNEHHSKVIKEVFSKAPDRLLISVAFAKSQGVSIIKQALEKSEGKSTVFVGIRNGITSFQALEMILETGAKLYVVDTGSHTTIFHPKMYLARFEKSVTVIIGSANLTLGGLCNNIEASSILERDLSSTDDNRFVDQAESAFDYLVTTYPDHVLHIKSKEDIESILEGGRIIDETVAANDKNSIPPKENVDIRPLMKLFQTSLRDEGDQVGVDRHLRVGKPNPHDYRLVWQSNKLTKRDLNIPTGKNTNPTGSMLWKKGRMEGIDQRHYFRDQVFANMDWSVDASKPHYERAHIHVHIVIKGEYKGAFNLRISHNMDKESESYKQNNSMTHVSWGEAKSLVAQSNLLGLTMTLYRKDSTPPEFMIEID